MADALLTTLKHRLLAQLQKQSGEHITSKTLHGTSDLVAPRVQHRFCSSTTPRVAPDSWPEGCDPCGGIMIASAPGPGEIKARNTKEPGAAKLENQQETFRTEDMFRRAKKAEHTLNEYLVAAQATMTV